MTEASQLWRVFSPATRETMPWCASWESLAAGSLTCYLINEIRAPAPGLDPFIGLGIPPIPHIAQPNCPLLALPPELLYTITDQISSLPDILSFSLTCNAVLSICLQKLRVSLHDRMRGAWINTPLICLGSITATISDLPRQIRKISQNIEVPLNARTAYNFTYRHGARGETFLNFERTHRLLKHYDRIEILEEEDENRRLTIAARRLASINLTRNRIPDNINETDSDDNPVQYTKSQLEARIFSTTPSLPNWTRRLVDRVINLNNGTLRLYSSSANYAIRNLSKREYIPFSAALKVKPEIESVFFSSNMIPLDQAVSMVFLFMISWSSSIAGLEDEIVRKDATNVHGIWAGDCFDVIEVEDLTDDWRSVEEETLLSLRLYLPRMYMNMHGQDRWGGSESRRGRTLHFLGHDFYQF
ncbi:hypothetical protein TWF730_007017 [Orbilia blumenaviensis]|uniref:F-box domain-containing protein n=1 Tax=Orbilia blumenaviensis TaxID=1796055 RepID=A0AAV9VHF6_9PEZI